MDKKTLFVSFSGGRTSGFMCNWLLENMADVYDFIFVFANTGCEHEKTYKFIDQCDKAFKLNLIWVETIVHKERIGCTHKIVNYKTAARDGKPFEEVIEKYGISNIDFPHCTRELKLNPMFSYKRSLGFKSNHPMAIGIRSDEINRMSINARKNGLIYPLCTMTQTTLIEIKHWWAKQNFNLEIPEHFGNCCIGIPCWKKSDRKLFTIAKYHPEWFSLTDRMEQTQGHTGAGNKKRVFFRKHRSTKDILEASQKPFNEFVDTMPEYQLSLLSPDERVSVILKMDEMDEEEECGASGCEIV